MSSVTISNRSLSSHFLRPAAKISVLHVVGERRSDLSGPDVHWAIDASIGQPKFFLFVRDG